MKLLSLVSVSKCFKKRRATELTESNKQARLERSRLQQLLTRYPVNLRNYNYQKPIMWSIVSKLKISHILLKMYKLLHKLLQ